MNSPIKLDHGVSTKFKIKNFSYKFSSKIKKTNKLNKKNKHGLHSNKIISKSKTKFTKNSKLKRHKMSKIHSFSNIKGSKDSSSRVKIDMIQKKTK